MNTLKLTAFAFALTTVFAVLPGTAAPKKTKVASKKAATQAASEIVTIINSGDRLSPGYRVTLTSSGALQGVVRTRTGKVTINRKNEMIGPTLDRFFEALRGAEPLNRLREGGTYTQSTTPQVLRQQGQRGQRGQRGRRGGFGNRPSTPTASPYAARVTGPEVFVIYRGVRSPNLRAAGDDKGKELYQRVKQAIEVLRLPIPDVP